MARLFVAVWPPDEILDLVAALPRPAVPGLRWTDRGAWHVTLRFLGRVAAVDDARRALGDLVPLAEPVDAVAGPRVDRFGRRVLHVPVAGLDALAAAVTLATARVGDPPEDRPFAGHLTLARTAKRASVDLRRLTGQSITGRWTVDEVCLVESRLSPRGASYEVLSRHPLARR